MTSENKKWENLKAEYLSKVEKALSAVKHPRGKEVLEDVSSHLDSRFAELEGDQHTWENFQTIITEMGPASDYAELLEPDTATTRRNISPKYLLLLGLILIGTAAAIILLPMAISYRTKPVALEEFRRDFPQKVAKLDIDKANLDDIIEIFGEPVEYVWGRQIIDRANIPTERYCIKYPDDFHIFMRWDTIVELRFESPAADYIFHNKIRVGSSLDEVLEVVGQPAETVEGKPIGWADGVLYKDIDGRKGYCYYHRSDRNVRFFFLNYKVKAMYITRSDYGKGR